MAAGAGHRVKSASMIQGVSPAVPSTEGSNRATVAAGFVTGLLSGLRARGIDPAPLLREAGLGREVLQDAGVRVPVASYAALYDAVVRHLDDEAFALFRAPLPTGTFEFLC